MTIEKAIDLLRMAYGMVLLSGIDDPIEHALEIVLKTIKGEEKEGAAR